MMDISDTLAPNSDQLDACDLLTGPRIFTVKNVSKGDPEQPVQVHLVEFPRPWRPGKSMRRVLASCWGVDASAWAGRQVELYCDPSVRFGSEAVGGTRIARLSNIDREQKIPLLISRGKSATYTVKPLALNAPDGRQSSVEPNRSLIPAEGEQAFGAGTTSTTRGGAESGTGASQSEAETPAESLLAAVNRQIKDMASSGGTAFLSTWCQSQDPPINPTSKALVERFGEATRDLRKLMGEPS